MEVNNFKKLEKQQEREYGPPPENIRKNLEGNINLFQFVGEIIELFLPRVFSLFIRMSGGAPRKNVSNNYEDGELKKDDKRHRYPNTFP